MQAVLLATSETDKLRPLTESIPAPMIRIVNRPVMEIAVETLARHGIKQIIVCLNQHAGTIEQYFGSGRRWGVQIQYVLVREAWGSAGVLSWAKPLINGDFLVAPADAFIDYNPAQAFEFHHQQLHLATAVVSEAYETSFHPETDGNQPIRAVPPTFQADKTYYETGVYVFSPEVFQHIPELTPCAIHAQLLPALREAHHPVGAYVMDGYWNRLETFRDLQEAQKVYLYCGAGNGNIAEQGSEKTTYRYPFIFAQQYAPGVWVGKNNSIHPSVRLSAPVLLGDNIRIGRNAIVGPEVVIGANVIISEEASVHFSTIFDDTYVGQLVHLEDRIIDKNLVIDYTTSAYLRIEDRFLLRRTPNSLEHSMYGRIFGLSVGLLLMLLMAPLMLAIYLLLLAVAGNPIVRLPRLGHRPKQAEREGNSEPRAFCLYHFRTRNEQQAFIHAGRFLERTELYRLPELWNLIRGDIRLVGVKPLSPDEIAQLQEDWQLRRNEYYSGLTGAWFVETEQNSVLNDIVTADVLYVATRSYQKDFRILLSTPRAWLRRIATWRKTSPELQEKI